MTWPQIARSGSMGRGRGFQYSMATAMGMAPRMAEPGAHPWRFSAVNDIVSFRQSQNNDETLLPLVGKVNKHFSRFLIRSLWWLHCQSTEQLPAQKSLPGCRVAEQQKSPSPPRNGGWNTWEWSCDPECKDISHTARSNDFTVVHDSTGRIDSSDGVRTSGVRWIRS